MSNVILGFNPNSSDSQMTVLNGATLAINQVLNFTFPNSVPTDNVTNILMSDTSGNLSYTSLSGITNLINSLQNQINNLQNQITSLQQNSK